MSNNLDTKNSESTLYADRSVKDQKILRNIGIIMIGVFLFVTGIVTGRVASADNPFSLSDIINGGSSISGDTSGDSKNIDFDLYWQVWDKVSNSYVDSSKVDESMMFYDSIKGMVTAFGDPHTVYLDPTETDDFNKMTSGNYFSGIGAELGYEDNWPVIVAPLKGSPAIAAGIRPGDKILKVDGVEISPDDSIFDLVSIVRGEKGTTVVLTVLHRGEDTPVDISIVRDDITVPSMELTFKDGVAVLEVSRFTDSSVAEWQANWDNAINQVVAKKSKSMILDLRGNPGGYMDAAIYAAGEFLPEGTVVMKHEDRDGHIQDYKVLRKGKLQNIELVILINDGSASASEILSGALQKNDRATLVGVESFGKGTAQDVIDFEDGSSLHVTVLKWLLPDGTWINEENKVVPDKVIELTNEDFKAGLDPQMDTAMQLLKK